MGLDFSHGDAHWSYGGFMRFRRAIAQHEGIDLDTMDGFPPTCTREAADWTAKSWDGVTTPIKPLLCHSDCDGHLTPEECRQIVPRLREIIDALWPAEGTGWEGEMERQRGLALVEGMELAAEAGENLEFM